MHGIAVGVVDLAVLERRADRRQLVAGGEQRDAQLALHLHLADAQRRNQAKLRRSQRLSGPQYRFAFLQIFARVADVLRSLLAGRHDDAVALLLDDLLDDDGVGTRGHHRAGHDAYAFAVA